MGGVRPSGMHVNKPVVFGVIGVVLAFIFIYKLWWGSASLVAFPSFSIGESAAGVDSGNQLNVASLSPAPALDPAVEAKLEVDAKAIEVPLGDKKLEVFRQIVKPLEGTTAKLDILLLHGAAFTSENWMTIKTLANLASWGYRAVALDTPGRGKSPGALSSEEMGSFVGAFIKAAGLEKVVIVAPSASGAAALPYLFDDPSQSMERAKGFVPVAPVFTNQYGAKFPQSQLPTLIVYGTNDPNGPSTARNLELLPQHTTAPIPDAGHPCYIEKPALFHTILYTWLNTLSS